ncbi:asparagine synthase (glutamine-hydrolyzing) [Hydrogenimonas sp.]
MCAIFGIIGPYDKEEALKAFETLSHRGPDAHGIVAEENLFLAHHRLAVIDPLPEADQPMSVSDAVILLNGEIYNYRELREELDFPFATESDTEVAAAAFLQWGKEMPKKLRGMYAMALWRDGVLHLFRDPFGKKPLFWAKIGERFVFASEIKAILSLAPSIRWSRERLHSYLFYQSFVSPLTFYPEIFQLEPGGYLRYEEGRIERECDDAIFLSPAGRRPREKKIEAILGESVAYRLVSDRPVGALLSGGIDSSLVAALAQRRMDAPLPTFTVGYKGYEKYDERPYAETVAAHIGSDHHAFEMGMEDFLEAADTLAEHLDEPLGDPAAVPLWFLSEKISKSGIRVLLSGDGADELFFGYRPYYEMADIEKANDLKFRNWLRNYFRSNYSPNREWEWYKRIFDGSVLFRSSAELFTDLQQNRLLKQNVKDDRSLEWIAHYIERFGGCRGAGWYSYIDIKVQLAELFLKKLDRVTMAHGIEARSPFMDRALAAELFSYDPGRRMGERPKELLVRIASDYLPPKIVSRKKKGFSYPYAEWLHASGALTVLEKMNVELKFFHPDALQFIMEKSKKGRFKHHLYTLWFFAKWLENRL